jgi:hypothetical protein
MKLNMVEGKEQYCIQISGNCYREYKNFSQRESKFEEGCSEPLDQRKQAKLQRLQDPSQINGDNLKSIRHEASGHLKNKKREYLTDKINELAINSKKKNIRELYRGVNEFKKSSQPTSNFVKDENDHVLADSHNVLNRWKNYFSQLLNVCRVSDVRQTEIHMSP